MAIASLMAENYYPEKKVLSCKPDGQDVCQSLQSEIDELKLWIDFIEENRRKETNMEEQFEDDVHDPSYQPNSSSDESMTGSEHNTQSDVEG